MAQRRGLGRGLGALIPTSSAPSTTVSPDAEVEVEVEPGTATPPEPSPSVVVDVSDSTLAQRGAPPFAAGPPERSAAAGESAAGSAAAVDASADALAAGRTATDPVGADSVVVESRVQPDQRSFAATPAEAGESGPDAGVARAIDSAGVPGFAEARDAGVAPAEVSELAEVPGVRYVELPVTAIDPNPRQPREVFDPEAMAELVHSIREIGLLQPIVVRPVGGDRYELVAGERRWRAVQQLGLPVVPAIVRDTADDVLLRDALLENLHRADLNALEEAAAYAQLLTDFGCTQEELATRIGRSRPQISNTLRLLRLPPVVARRLAAGVLSAGHARALLGLDDPEVMEHLAGRIVAEGLSVRTVEEIISVGEADGRARTRVARPRGERPSDPRAREAAERLQDRLDTRVRVELGRARGRIVIDVADAADLRRVLDLISPA
ncbi:MAG: ParB/RepB/Spo0J family partition protein [Actinomycetota bacterium]|nr:MAG: ParB/RepB/Spo0J family partition protein [Actinomycetota bacterium]